MKKNNLLKIAKTIYLQNIVSKQIFASLYNPNKIIQRETGSLRSSQKLLSCFQCFIGSTQRTKKVQFIKKNGMKFTVYKFDLNGNATDQIAKQNITIEQLNYFLRTLQVVLKQHIGAVSLSKLFEKFRIYAIKTNDYIDKLIDQDEQPKSQKETKNSICNFGTQLQSYFNAFKDTLKKLSILISSQGNSFQNSINIIQSQIEDLKNIVKTEDAKQQINNILQSTTYLNNILSDQNVQKNIIKSISTNSTRIDMLEKIYKVVKQAEQYNQANNYDISILNQIENCNTSDELNQQIANDNLVERYDILDRSYNGQKDNKQKGKKIYETQARKSYAITSYIKFLKKQQSKIKFGLYHQAYLKIKDEQGISQNLSDVLAQLDEYIDQFENKLSKNKLTDIKSNEKSLFYQDLQNNNPVLMEKVDSVVSEL